MADSSATATGDNLEVRDVICGVYNIYICIYI
jgi:hypothetical protein